jgi:hypothetical protein
MRHPRAAVAAPDSYTSELDLMHTSSNIRHLAMPVVFSGVLAAGPGGLTRCLLDQLPFSFERNDGQDDALATKLQ